MDHNDPLLIPIPEHWNFGARVVTFANNPGKGIHTDTQWMITEVLHGAKANAFNMGYHHINVSTNKIWVYPATTESSQQQG